MQLLLIIGGVAWALPAAGTGYFMSTDQIEEVNNPLQLASRQFLLRQGTKEFRYFLAPMSDLLYKSKKKFTLPQAELAQRFSLSFFANYKDALARSAVSEVILNERLALTDSDSLYVLMPDSSIQFLQPVTSLGVTLVMAPPGTLATRVDARGPIPARELPSFYYTFKGSVQLLVAERPGFRPTEIEPWAESDSYREILIKQEEEASFVSAIDLPVLNLRPDSNRFSLDSLDRMIQQNATVKSRLEQEFVSYLQNLDSALYVPLSKRSYESADDYRVRLAFHDSLLLQQRRIHAKDPDYINGLRELDGRHSLMTSYKSQLASERHWGTGGAQEALLEKSVLRRFYVRVFGSLGRNMPDWSSDRDPTRLWAAGAGVSYLHPLFGQNAGELRLNWQHSRWLYSEDYSTSSTQSRADFDALLCVPLAVAAQSSIPGEVDGVVVQWLVGVGGAWSTSHVFGNQVYRSRSGPALQGLTGMQFHFTKVPLVVEGLYSYGTDGFGDLSVALGLPLPWGIGQEKKP